MTTPNHHKGAVARLSRDLATIGAVAYVTITGRKRS
jgi:hypothetical protein